MKKIIFLPFFVFFLFPLSTFAATYYVSNSGSDTSDGASQLTPWQTLAKVNSSTFNPGDQILFEKGNTWQGTLTIPSSGSSGNPIIFGAYGSGAKPVIDGNGAQYTITGASNVSYVTIDGIDITDTGATINASQVSVNIPAGATNWTIQNSDIHGTTAKRLRYGIYMSSATGGSHTIKDNMFQYINERGVYSFVPTSTNLRTNILITGNTFDNIAGAGAAKEFPIVGTFNAGSVISNNTITNSATSAGANHAIYIYFSDGTGNPVQIKYNKIDHSGLNNQMLKLGVSNKYVDVSYNLISNSSDGIAIDSIDAPDTNTFINIYNNTLANLTSDNVTAIFINYADNVNVKNNLIYEVNGKSTVKTKYNISLANLTNAVFSNNLAYAASPWNNSGDIYAYNDDGFIYYKLANWNALVGTISVNGDIWSIDPLLTNPTSGDYSLQLASPAINAGVDIGLPKDILGNPIVGLPDIGAYENQTVPATTYTLSGPTLGTVNSTSTIFTVTPNNVYNGTITITPSGGGLSTPIILTFSHSQVPQTFTITPIVVGNITLTATNDGSLANPNPITYAVSDVSHSSGGSNVIVGYMSVGSVYVLPVVKTSDTSGCTSLTKYSPLTGALCSTSSQNVPAGCLLTTKYSSLTGQICPNYQASSQSILSNYFFNKNLSFGVKDKEVKLLQQYLNQNGFIVSSTGAGSRGNETEIFGPATQKALARFQVSRNIIPSSGYFGPKTRAFIISTDN